MKITFISSIVSAILLVGCAENNTKKATSDVYNANGFQLKRQESLSLGIQYSLY